MARRVENSDICLAKLDMLMYPNRRDGDIEEEEISVGHYSLTEFNEKTNEYEPVDQKAEKESDQHWSDIQQYLRKIPESLRPCPEGPRFAHDLDNSSIPVRKSREHDLDDTPEQAFK